MTIQISLSLPLEGSFVAQSTIIHIHKIVPPRPRTKPRTKNNKKIGSVVLVLMSFIQ